MTLIDLYTEEKDAKNIKWKEFIRQKNKFFQQISTRFDKENIQPTITMESMVIDFAIQLVVSLPKEQQAIIQEVANTFNLNDHVPEKFHITLGYQYQWYETGDDALEVNNHLHSILSEFQTQNQCFTLEKPRLCYFNDMTAFTPWDGKGFPFNKSPKLSLYGLFKSMHPKGTEEYDLQNCILS
jgi:hypothetical protein